ncbi:hypothetical protein GCM10010987_64020 [Bradyrhizobium guangdongense]|uniref:Uncharacterized protein n=1 Tax=Bradyrhizobium guangdongense TaxID=1325090 RepID=A0AA87WDJ9_9BRAD|nr:hypothetical protein GCM10010987_64020 [Bradyrhizobium guangdongense]
MEYSAVSGTAADQRAECYKINVKSLCELADLCCDGRYAHSHAVVNKLELMTLSDFSDMKNGLTKCSKNAFRHRKERLVRSNDRIEKAELSLFGATCYWGIYKT